MLTDFVRLRWQLVEQGYGSALENPKEMRRGGDIEALVASKSALREELRPVVKEQLAHPAVIDFRRRMEADVRCKRSVRTVVADPHELAQRLDAAVACSGEDRAAALSRAVKPYLQRATEDPDPVTGQSLREIWRQFRYSWSIPQVPVPGRQLLYLVRDKGHPDAPVIGIASLNNCPLASQAEARVAVFSFVDGWYNPVRLHSALGYRSPIDYERQMKETQMPADLASTQPSTKSG